ncbi:Hypothetical protein SMAX5B_015340 [Scophthalmus maximus]|uniref:Uncharacterized protein n=1 Tax=Scophthalmus maximus TaxID=52904 RepID=A0A2U9CAA5_SCOMX|nr:Hypothetical protein SMAX5B_015340 [Scophthalmus maximus]
MQRPIVQVSPNWDDARGPGWNRVQDCGGGQAGALEAQGRADDLAGRTSDRRVGCNGSTPSASMTQGYGEDLGRRTGPFVLLIFDHEIQACT